MNWLLRMGAVLLLCGITFIPVVDAWDMQHHGTVNWILGLIAGSVLTYPGRKRD